jgi:hypothetical protein
MYFDRPVLTEVEGVYHERKTPSYSMTAPFVLRLEE